MNYKDMYAWWNGAARQNPMSAILSGNESWDQGAFFESGRAWLTSHREFASVAGVTLGGERALDFGCGIGRMTAALADHYTEVVGVDISDRMIELATSMSESGRTTFQHVPEPPLPFPDQSFDCTYSTIVVQHIPFPFNLVYVQELFRLSRGIVLFDAPSHLLHGRQAGDGIFLIDRQHILTCARENGLDLLALRYYPATDTRHYQYLFSRRQVAPA